MAQILPVSRIRDVEALSPPHGFSVAHVSPFVLLRISTAMTQ